MRRHVKIEVDYSSITNRDSVTQQSMECRRNTNICTLVEHVL